MADVVGVEGVVGELAGLADRRAGQRGIVGCLLQACRLEVVSEGLLQVAPAGDLAGLRDGDFRSLALEGWRGGRLAPESAGLSRMPSRRTMAGKAVALAGVLGRGISST